MKTWISLLPMSALLVASNSSAENPSMDQAHPLRLNLAPIVIDEPGHYVATRNWTIAEPATDPLISVVADNVTIDLRGFTINYAVHQAPPIIEISGSFVTVKGGRLLGGAGDVATPTLVRSTGSFTSIASMTLSSPSDALHLQGSGARVLDSAVGGRTGVMTVGSGLSIERTRIGCAFVCLAIHDRTRILDSHVEGTNPLWIRGNGNELSNSHVTSQVDIDGNWNLVRGNVFSDVGIVNVNGTGNVLEANVMPRGPNGQIVNEGIRFSVSGNFYGNNRVAATVPFDLGGTTQTNWGGNVGF